MTSSQSVDDIHPNESISQANYYLIDFDDDIYGDEGATQSTANATTFGEFASTTSRKSNLFYVRNKDDKEAAAAMLKILPKLILLRVGRLHRGIHLAV
jgi:hypothetical protein